MTIGTELMDFRQYPCLGGRVTARIAGDGTLKASLDLGLILAGRCRFQGYSWWSQSRIFGAAKSGSFRWHKYSPCGSPMCIAHAIPDILIINQGKWKIKKRKISTQARVQQLDEEQLVCIVVHVTNKWH